MRPCYPPRMSCASGGMSAHDHHSLPALPSLGSDATVRSNAPRLREANRDRREACTRTPAARVYFSAFTTIIIIIILSTVVPTVRGDTGDTVKYPTRSAYRRRARTKRRVYHNRAYASRVMYRPGTRACCDFIECPAIACADILEVLSLLSAVLFDSSFLTYFPTPLPVSARPCRLSKTGIIAVVFRTRVTQYVGLRRNISYDAKRHDLHVLRKPRRPCVRHKYRRRRRVT